MASATGSAAHSMRGVATPAEGKAPTPMFIVLLAIGGTLIGLGVFASFVWRPAATQTVVAIPVPPPPAVPAPLTGDVAAGRSDTVPSPSGSGDQAMAPGDGSDSESVGRPDSESVGRPDSGFESAGDETDEAAGMGAEGDVEPAFVEAPMQVIRRSNIRSRPTPRATALGRAEVGSIVLLVDPDPVRGYYRIASDDREGWIWGSNITAADPAGEPADSRDDPPSDGDPETVAPTTSAAEPPIEPLIEPLIEPQ